MKNKTVLLSCLLFFASTSPAHAYLDPGTGSILLQGLIAGITAAATAVTLYWRKIKDFFRKSDKKNK